MIFGCRVPTIAVQKPFGLIQPQTGTCMQPTKMVDGFKRAVVWKNLLLRRPSAAREALGLSPLVETGWAHASRVERVPLMSAGAEPLVFFAGHSCPDARYADCFAGASAISAMPTITSAGTSPSRCPRSLAFWNACTAIIAA